MDNCVTCKYYRPLDLKNYSDYFLADIRARVGNQIGYCDCPNFISYGHYVKDDRTEKEREAASDLIHWPWTSYGSNFVVMDNFGCVHHKENEAWELD